MNKKYFGVIPPIITPVDDYEKVDEKGFRALLSHCIANGIHGIFVAGSNGETMALTQKERNRAIQIALDEVADRVPVMAGVMDSSTKRVIENIKELEQMGGKAAVVTPVFYARHASHEESIRHFEEISRHTQIDLLVYNIPLYTGTKLPVEVIFKLAEIDKVCGYKDTSGSFPDFIKCLYHFKDSDFILLQGATNLSAASLLLGADGYIPSMAPLFPEPHIKMYEYARQGNIEKTMAYNKLILEMSAIWSMTTSQTSATKYAISTTGLCGKRVIEPSEPILPEEEKAIDAKITEIQNMINRMTTK